MTKLPKPLTPASLDLRDFRWMPLDIIALIGSDTWAMAASVPGASRACINLWATAWHQVPAASLPDDEGRLSRWADVSDWHVVRTIALRGFIACDDGRMYHPVLAKAAIKAGQQKEARAAAKEATRQRQNEWRERKRLKEQSERNVLDDASHNSDVTRDVTAKTRPDKKSSRRAKKERSSTNSSLRMRANENALASPPEGGERISSSAFEMNGEDMNDFLIRMGVEKGSKIVQSSANQATYLTSDKRIPITREQGVLGPWPKIVE